MPRVYVRKTQSPHYANEELERAVEAIKNNKMSGYEASKVYKIPRTTIMAHVTGHRGRKSKTMGRPSVLSPEIEEKLAENLHYMDKNGPGLSKKELLKYVGEYIKENHIETPFKDSVPGYDWFIGFTKRHKLSFIQNSRIKPCDPFIINEYYDLLAKTIEELDLGGKPSSIWNLHETIFGVDPSKTKMARHRSTRTISTPKRENTTTVLICCSADGDKCPLMIAFAGKYIKSEWLDVTPESNVTYVATKKGCMDTEVFEYFFINNFLSSVSTRPLLLLYDGHFTHLSIKVFDIARQNNVTIVKLPAKTSHLLQPMNLSVMKCLKCMWDQELIKWQRLHFGSIMPKNVFSKLIFEIWTAITPEIMKSGFRRSGIYPLNRNVISKEKFDPDAWVTWEKSKAKMSQPSVSGANIFPEESSQGQSSEKPSDTDTQQNESQE